MCSEQICPAFGACLGTPAKVNVTLLDNNNEKPHFWVVHWFLIRYVGNKRIRTFTGKRSVTFTIYNPELNDTGKIYEVEVSNRYGRARGETRIIVTKDVPEITWVTPSPHVAVKDISDILEVKIDNEKTLITVEWYHNGTQIERKTEGFTFPGERYGSSSFRKKLKLTRISFDTAGTYRVVARGKYCQFEKKVEVRVIIKPRLIAQPHAVYQRLPEGEPVVNINVTVRGGEPKARLQDMVWKKSGIPLKASLYGRVLLHTTFTKKENWLTVLIIRNLKESDSGDYTFTVKIGPAVMSVTRSIVVIPKQEYTNATVSPDHTKPPLSRASRFYHSFSALFMQFLYLSSGLACSWYH